MKFKLPLIYILIYLFVYFCIYSLHVNFFEINTLLYASIFDAFISSLIASIFFIPRYKRIGFERVLLYYIISILIGYSIAITFPAVIDRSLSVYILEEFDKTSSAFSQNEINNLIVNKYMYDYRVTEMRITEQINSGTIYEDNGKYYLTNKGHFIATFTRFFRLHFLPKKRLIMNTYSNELVN